MNVSIQAKNLHIPFIYNYVLFRWICNHLGLNLHFSRSQIYLHEGGVFHWSYSDKGGTNSRGLILTFCLYFVCIFELTSG